MRSTRIGRLLSREVLTHRMFLILATLAGANVLPGSLFASRGGKKSFTILRPCDLHPKFTAVAPPWTTSVLSELFPMCSRSMIISYNPLQ